MFSCEITQRHNVNLKLFMDYVNFDIGIIFWNVYCFVVFCWIYKKDKLHCDIFIEINQSFLYLEGVEKYISQQIKKLNKNLLIYDGNFKIWCVDLVIWTPCQMRWSTHLTVISESSVNHKTVYLFRMIFVEKSPVKCT